MRISGGISGTPTEVAFRKRSEISQLSAFMIRGANRTMWMSAKRFHPVDELSGSPIAEAIGNLAKAEVVHGKAIPRMLAGLAPDTEGDFEALFEGLSGDLIENGESYEVVVARARELGTQGPLALLAFALEIDLEACDLYKNLAGTVGSVEAEAARTDLAQQEKQHADSVLQALGTMAA
jgi:hypothetical protein